MAEMGGVSGQMKGRVIKAGDVVVECSRCGLLEVPPPKPDRPGFVSIEPITGWIAPPVLCPNCS